MWLISLLEGLEALLLQETCHAALLQLLLVLLGTGQSLEVMLLPVKDLLHPPKVHQALADHQLDCL